MGFVMLQSSFATSLEGEHRVKSSDFIINNVFLHPFSSTLMRCMLQFTADDGFDDSWVGALFVRDGAVSC